MKMRGTLMDIVTAVILAMSVPCITGFAFGYSKKYNEGG
jgi:hypothetical protein